MSKERWILAIGGLATGLIDVVGWMMFRDTTTCVAARVARAHSTVRLDHAQGVPGAYRHRPGGFEEVDALSGGRHEYPGETFMTIALSEIGLVIRGDALAERWIYWSTAAPIWRSRRLPPITSGSVSPI